MIVWAALHWLDQALYWLGWGVLVFGLLFIAIMLFWRERKPPR